MRELGPPPPGYGRYADFDGNGPWPGNRPPGGGGSGGPPGPRRNIEDVVCFKVRLPSQACYFVPARVSSARSSAARRAITRIIVGTRASIGSGEVCVLLVRAVRALCGGSGLRVCRASLWSAALVRT